MNKEKIHEDARQVINPPENWGDIEPRENSTRPAAPADKQPGNPKKADLTGTGAQADQ